MARHCSWSHGLVGMILIATGVLKLELVLRGSDAPTSAAVSDWWGIAASPWASTSVASIELALGLSLIALGCKYRIVNEICVAFLVALITVQLLVPQPRDVSCGCMGRVEVSWEAKLALVTGMLILLVAVPSRKGLEVAP